MITKAIFELENECRALRDQVKRLKRQVKRQKEKIAELESKRDTLRYLIDHPLTEKDKEELERWGKETMEAWERGDKFYTWEEMMEEVNKVLQNDSWKKKANSKSSSRKR